MFITVTHNMAITHNHSLEKNKKTLQKMFSETKCMEQESSKNRPALVKTNCFYIYAFGAKTMMFIL